MGKERVDFPPDIEYPLSYGAWYAPLSPPTRGHAMKSITCSTYDQARRVSRLMRAAGIFAYAETWFDGTTPHHLILIP